MISEEEVQHIAELARLELSDEGLRKMQKELAAILKYIDLLKEVDVSGIKPTSHSIPLENVMREDKVEPANKETLKDILAGVPEKEGNYVKVKGIL